MAMCFRRLLLLVSLMGTFQWCFSQYSALNPDYSVPKPDTEKVTGDSLSTFDRVNQKMEKLFKKFPVPMYSFSTEAGHTFGLAKYNLFPLDRSDQVSPPSRLSEVATFSTEGRINVSVSTDLNWHKGKYMISGFVNYKKQSEYILGIGNDVSAEDLEEISVTRLKFVNYFMYKVVKNMYLGIGVDLTNYSRYKDSTSFLFEDHVLGTEGGTSTGIGMMIVYDNRDNRYNASEGWFLAFSTTTFPAFTGNPYQYAGGTLDLRKYFNPWFKHVLALQATTSFRTGEVPFYDLAMLGGEDQMRGYYKGALRDMILIDCQMEYRMPIWKIFGMTAFLGTGRVAEKYSEMSLDGFRPSYGLGIRIRMDTENNANLRFDWGFGPKGVNGFYINFAEAF